MPTTILLKVLVIEDDPLTASQITSNLTGLGWSVDFAASGKAALKQQQQQQYDVILLDTTLPDMCPKEVYAQMKHEQGSTTPVLCMRTDTFDASLHREDDIIPDVTDVKDIIARCQSAVNSSAYSASA